MFESLIKGWMITVCLALLLAILWPIISFGAEPTAGDWFKTLRQPGTGISCCDESDCRQIDDDQWRVGADGYEVILHGQWVKVPDNKVLDRPDGPIKRAVLCAMQNIFCFRPGTLS